MKSPTIKSISVEEFNKQNTVERHCIDQRVKLPKVKSQEVVDFASNRAKPHMSIGLTFFNRPRSGTLQ